MKITQKRVRQIIKEEISRRLSEGVLYIWRYEDHNGFSAEDNAGEDISTGDMVKALLDAGHDNFFTPDGPGADDQGRDPTSLQNLQDSIAKGVQGGVERWDSDVFPIYYNVDNNKVIEFFAGLKGYEVEEVDELPQHRQPEYVETEEDREAAKAEYDFESYYS
jgi:hypothetical protein